MITRIAYKLEDELEKKYGKNVLEVSLNKEGNAIRIRIKNHFGYATYSLFDESMVEHIVKDIVETIQEDFIYGRSTDEED